MATSTAHSPPPSRHRVESWNLDERFIDRQLSSARRQIKLLELLSAGMTLAAGCLAFLLLVTVLDHWVVDLGSAGRWTAWALLAAGGLVYATLGIAPLLFRPIHPLFAARTIEDGTPSLKNSLINFWLMRARRTTVPDVVYQTLESRAARDLAGVPAAAALDRSRVIHVGYVLVGVLTAAAIYAMASPKDPFRTVSRVMAPWAEIARPSRVQITDVTPGDIELFQGQTLPVTAQVRGEPEDVRLLYTTRDGQTVDAVVPMTPSAGGLRHEAVLPPSGAGIDQDLVYRIQAGDAVTRSFQVRVSPAPYILVTRLDYEFPQYTGRAPQSVTHGGDIRALEGTRVTVHAEANRPIRDATMEVRRTDSGGTDEWISLPMEIGAAQAHRTWLLELDPDRRQPREDAYRLSFHTPEGHPSEQPVVHRIEVTADLSPEIALLTPKNPRVEVPLNGSQSVEIRALDPDYGLCTIALRAVVSGADVVNQRLLDDPAGRIGQQVVRYEFRPQQLGLKVGDQVTYWATAEDNRREPGGQSPAPNAARTPSYQLLVTAPQRIRPAESAAQPDAQQGRGQEGGASNSEDAADGSTGGGAGGQPQSSGQAGDPQPGQPQASSQPGDSTGQPSPGNQGTSGEAGTAGESQSPSGAGGDAQGQSGNTPSPSDPPTTPQREPLHDGEVIERVMEYLQPGAAPQDAGDGGDQQRGEGQGGADQPTQTTGQNSGSDSDAPRPPDRADPQNPTQNPRTDSNGQSPSGAAGSDPPSTASRDPQADPQPPDSAAGNNTGGPTGSGRPGADASSTETPAQPRDKTPDTAQGEPTRQPDSGASDGQRDSDSQGDSGGDQRGGGQQGAGQSAGQAGRGSPGSNSQADDGAGAANQPGAGQQGPNPGVSQPSDRATGQQGNTPGPGSTSGQRSERPTDGGQSPSDSGTPGAPSESPPSATRPGSGQRPAHGGGLPSENTPPDGSPQPDSIPDGEAANLEYARQATELVVRHLRDESRRLDPRLLQQLNWSAEDVQKFVQRWERLQRSATETPAGRSELDASLRSLGLRPPLDRLREQATTRDALPGLHEAGASAPPPASYRDQFEAFMRARARLSE